ncbi:MAG: ABC transporter permease subunit, partial [Nitrospinota bacterium]
FLDTWHGMIIIYTITTIPYAVWMTKSFIDEVPEEMEQAAQLLGASKLRAFVTVVVPLIRSGVVATCLFILILTWSEYLLGLVMTAADAQTLPVQLSKFEGANEGRLYGLQSALSIGVTLPLIIIGILIHKHLVRGFSFGMIRRQ